MATVQELRPAPEAVEVFTRLCRRPHCLFLDSARRDPALGRYSFVAADPFSYWERGVGERDALGELAARLSQFSVESLPDLPPFQGGAAGLFSYDLGRQLERLPAPPTDEFGVPALAIGLYDVVFAFDHLQSRAWIVSQGLPETDPLRRERRAEQRLREALRWLEERGQQWSVSGGRWSVNTAGLRPATPPALTTDHQPPTTPPPTPDPSLAASDLAPCFEVLGPPGLVSNFSRAEYLRTVERAIEYIRAGDIFQVNLAQRLLFPAHDDAVALYLRLRERNPATFAGYFNLGAFQIASASPERFLQVVGGEVEARPIKGTRQRTALPEADLFAGDELAQSEKDRAENVMIVDLLRNDLSRVCLPESVQVTQLCRLETYEFVQHLVSAIRGRLRPGLGPVDLLRAAFPCGSITGAPKVRAMEIIAELEPTARGAYCGALGYLGFDGAMDTSVLIRTITAGRGWWQAPVGGGIVAQSDPQREYEETWHKATGLLRAFEE